MRWLGVQKWQPAGLVGAGLIVGGLLLYGFWPVPTGGAEKAREESRTDQVATGRPEVTAVVIEPVSLHARIRGSGRLVPWQVATISAERDRRVVERLVKEGDVVVKGDPIVRLDDREERIALAEARAELLKAQAEFAVLSNFSDSKPDADTSHLGVPRRVHQAMQRSFANGEVSSQDVRNAARRYEAARVATGVERRNVMAAQTGLAGAEQAVARAQLHLDRTQIRAPFTGRIADLDVEVGQRVSRGQPVATVLQDRRLKVEVDVLESDIIDIREGAGAQVRIPSLGTTEEQAGTTFKGTVWAINPQVDTESGTARVTVALSNSDRNLVAGLYASVRIETKRLDSQLAVPSDAVLVRQGRNLVFVIRDGRARWTYVDVGRRSGPFVSLARGVSAGDTVAVSGHFTLAHDVPVDLREIRPIRTP